MSGKLTALLVEDDPGDALLLEELVADCRTVPVELLQAGSLAEAFEVLKRAHVDVLLLDLSLPDAFGTGTVARAIGMSRIASEAGLARPALYRALAEDGNPSLATIARVLGAMGLRLTVEPTRSDAA